jgi:hypothetical protein
MQLDTLNKADALNLLFNITYHDITDSMPIDITDLDENDIVDVMRDVDTFENEEYKVNMTVNEFGEDSYDAQTVSFLVSSKSNQTSFEMSFIGCADSFGYVTWDRNSLERFTYA